MYIIGQINPGAVIKFVGNDLVDSVGGDTFTVSGTGLAGSTLQFSSDAVTWTSLTSPSSTATTASGTTPSTTVGTIYVRALRADGRPSNIVAIESWNPTVGTTALSGFWDRGGYSVSAGTGTWTRRSGTFNMTGGSTTSPTDAGGYPSFNGTNQLLVASTIENVLQTSTAQYAGTVAIICTPSSAPTQTGNGTTGDIGDKSLFGDSGRGSIGLNYTNRVNTAASVPGFTAIATDGSYRTVTAGAAVSSVHAVLMRFNDRSPLELSVDGVDNSGVPGFSTFSSFGTYSASTGENFNVGSGYTSNYYAGDMRAVVTLKEKASNTWATKFRKWGASRFGAGSATLGVPSITGLSSEFVDTLGGTVITVTGIGLDTLTALKVGNTSVSFTVISSTSCTFTAPSKSVGAWGVVGTNSSGDSLPYLLEYWDPSAEVTATSLFERPSYSSSTGVWTARYSSYTFNSTTPNLAANGGAPVLNAAQYLSSSVNITTLLGASAGTVACVVSPTNETNPEASTSTPYANKAIWSKVGSGPIELWNATDSTNHWFGFSLYDSTGVYLITRRNVTNLLNNPHAVVCSYKQAGYMQLSVDGSSPTLSQTSTPGAPLTYAGLINIGANYVSTPETTGEMRAFCTFSGEVSNLFAGKFYQWAKLRHGVA